MSAEHPERLPADRRLRTSDEHAAIKAGGTAVRGRCCILVVLPRPGEVTKVGFVASRRSVGGAVERNRARRRLREILRRRWPRIISIGFWLEFIALKPVLSSPHEALATEVEHLLASAGALRPILASTAPEI
ncbi:MAG: ribonuclease P protein component [Candidatus Eisenbacteria bacterium]